MNLISSINRTEKSPINNSESNDSFFENDENIEPYILNEKNIHITKKYINGLLKKYKTNYKIKDLPTFQRSMTHTSYLELDLKNEKNPKKKYSFIKDYEIEPINNKVKDKTIPLQFKSYERLEFLGDSVIRTILADYLYKRYEDEDEGFMTKLRTKIEKGESLAKLSLLIGLNKYAIISRILEEKGYRERNVAVLEDIFEAFIGALYCESNFDICKTFFVNLIETEIDIAELLYHNDNYKNTLLQYYHKVKWSPPTYDVLSQNETANKKEYVVCVKDGNGKIIGIGSGPSKKKSQQIAAKQALIHLKVINEDSDGESDYECEYDIGSDSDISDDEYIVSNNNDDNTIDNTGDNTGYNNDDNTGYNNDDNTDDNYDKTIHNEDEVEYEVSDSSECEYEYENSD